MNSNCSDKESFQDCFTLIRNLDSISNIYGEAKPSRFDENGQVSSFYITINVDEASLFLNDVLIGGQVKRIAESNNQVLISDFYKTLQKVYTEVENSRIYSNILQGLLMQIRDSFCKALPANNKTKIEIENNVQIISERGKNINADNKITEKPQKAKEIITDNIVKISVLLFGLALCYMWGKTILLIYVLIICLGLLAGVFSQLKNRSKKIEKTKGTDNTQPKVQPQKKEVNHNRPKSDFHQKVAIARKDNNSSLPNEIINISFKIGEQVYSNFLTSFKINKDDYGVVSKLEADLYSFFICDMLSYSIYKNEKLRADILNAFLIRINDKYTFLVSGNINLIKARLENYFKTYKSILDKSSETNGFKSIEQHLLYILLNTSKQTQIQEDYIFRPNDMFERVISTKRFLMRHNEYLKCFLEELKKTASNYTA